MAPESKQGFLERVATWWNAFEQILLAVLIGLMVLLGALQVVLRNFFHKGLSGADRLLGAALLWLTMLGALAATGRLKHISIDVAAQWLPPRLREAARLFTSLFATIVCVCLTFASIRFVKFRMEMGVPATGGVPTWVELVIVPVGFGLLAARFALHAVWAGVRAGRRSQALEKTSSR